MRPFAALAWMVAACGQARPVQSTAKLPEAARADRDSLAIPRAPFAIVPAELGDDHVLDRIPHRAMVKRWSIAWLTDNGAPIGDASRTAIDDERQIVPVLGERGRRIRIVVDDDHARYAAWIARDDAWSTALVPLAISEGVTVEPGIALELGDPEGALREVAIVDEMLIAHGRADVRALGEVWIAPKPVPRPRAYDVLVRLPSGAQLRARADGASPMVAIVSADELVVGKLGVTGDFTEVEVQRPYVRARGFVPTAQVLGTSDDFITRGTGSGHGFGMSHATKHEVPAGTCLYDRAEGDVIGVTLAAQTRLGGRLGEDGWAMVYIDSPWRVTSMYMKNLATDPPQPPRWDSCTEPVHRR
ncbi:MAG: hypothetical protein JNL83_10965 [Myxococcales bacterium]|nr:hypothetical protein [Myxococcales bacterium]